MNSHRKSGCWILIAILLSLQIYVGEQQATSCPPGKFLAPVGADNTAAKACVEQKYFVYDADFYASATVQGTCLAADVKITLVGGVQKGCMPLTEITYLCGSYSRTANGAAHGIYACTGCPAGAFKYIVTVATATAISTIGSGMNSIANPLNLATNLLFKKACTVEVIPNCATYQFSAAAIGSGTYGLYRISVCDTCPGATIVTQKIASNFFYINEAVFAGSSATPANFRLGKACPLKLLIDNSNCVDVLLSDDRQSYRCKTDCTNYFKYQQGTYTQLCEAAGGIHYYDIQCALYDNFDSQKTLALATSTGKASGNCIKCRNPTTHDLLVVKDTIKSNIIRNACILKTKSIEKQPCTSYSWNPLTSTLTCTGCPSGYTYDTTRNVCVLDDRYLKAIPNCQTYDPPASTTATSIGCAACKTLTPTVTLEYCTTFTLANTDRTSATLVFFGGKCGVGDAGKIQIAGTFVRKDTNAPATAYACVTAATAVIDACTGYQVIVVYGANPPYAPTVATAISTTPYSCDVCASGYTRVLSQVTRKYICIKNELVDKNCGTYYILTLSCRTCVTGSAIDPVTRKCKAPSDYTANCANATTDLIYESDGTTLKQTRYRCIGCLPGFTLINIGQADFCLPSVIGCANLNILGICSSCASPNHQVVAQKFCVALPLNCKNVALNGTCIDCKDGFIFNTVTSACSQVAASGSSAQVACPDGQYFDSNGVCVVGSITNCLKYIVSGASIKCSSCKTGFHTSNFGAQCDLDDPAQAGVKCKDKPAGDSFVWYESPQSGACLKKDKHCGNSSFEDLDKKIVHCSTCDDPTFYPRDGRCYQYGLNANAVANN